jgi:predicted GIY-YIG superfamily endonuclease
MPQTFVYVLRSVRNRDHYYVGLTSNVNRRVDEHNRGESRYTSGLRPWELVVSLEFSKAASAAAFERHLKTGSGRAFAKRHFV